MIIEWLTAALGDTIPASEGKEVRVNCPFCYGRIGRIDEKFHMYVSQVHPVAFCFRCGWQGNYVSLIMSVSGCGYAEALKQLEEPTPNVTRFEHIFSPMGLIMGHKETSTPSGFQFVRNPEEVQSTLAPEERAVWNYLTRVRGIPKYIVCRNMGWVPGTLRAWILVDTNFWQGRLIVPGEPKYLSSPWPKGDSLWNASALDGVRLTICEGVFSALAVGSKAIALCGKTLTQPQASRIARSKVKRIRIMLDADATAGAYEMARVLQDAGFSGEIVIHELCQGDPTDGLDGTERPYEGWATEVLRGLSEADFNRLYQGNYSVVR